MFLRETFLASLADSERCDSQIPARSPPLPAARAAPKFLFLRRTPQTPEDDRRSFLGRLQSIGQLVRRALVNGALVNGALVNPENLEFETSVWNWKLWIYGPISAGTRGNNKSTHFGISLPRDNVRAPPRGPARKPRRRRARGRWRRRRLRTPPARSRPPGPAGTGTGTAPGLPLPHLRPVRRPRRWRAFVIAALCRSE